MCLVVPLCDYCGIIIVRGGLCDYGGIIIVRGGSMFVDFVGYPSPTNLRPGGRLTK